MTADVNWSSLLSRPISEVIELLEQVTAERDQVQAQLVELEAGTPAPVVEEVRTLGQLTAAHIGQQVTFVVTEEDTEARTVELTEVQHGYMSRREGLSTMVGVKQGEWRSYSAYDPATPCRVEVQS